MRSWGVFYLSNRTQALVKDYGFPEPAQRWIYEEESKILSEIRGETEQQSSTATSAGVVKYFNDAPHYCSPNCCGAERK